MAESVYSLILRPRIFPLLMTALDSVDYLTYVVASRSADTPRPLRILNRGGQAVDHAATADLDPREASHRPLAAQHQADAYGATLVG
jgi:hypothetical protein